MDLPSNQKLHTYLTDYISHGLAYYSRVKASQFGVSLKIRSQRILFVYTLEDSALIVQKPAARSP